MERNPFRLSAPFAIDPAYSHEFPIPTLPGGGLFSDAADGVCWLYATGALEAWLFSRLRRDAFSTCSSVYHPGRFRPFSPSLFAKLAFPAELLSGATGCQLGFCGQLTFFVNGRAAFRGESQGGPALVEVDLAPYLQPGENSLKLRLHSHAEPPTFHLQAGGVMSGQGWSVSCDDLCWNAPERVKALDHSLPPHHETMPELRLKAERGAAERWDFGREVFGRLLVSSDAPELADVQVGESIEEALDVVPANREQKSPGFQHIGGVHEGTELLALRHVRVEAGGVELAAPAYPVQYRGAFACADDRLNAIWMGSAYTLRLCMRELFVDGLKRDRLPWVGDLYLAGLCNCFSFFDAKIVRRSLLALYGDEPETLDFNGIIDYSLFWVVALNDYLMHFGDLEFVERVAPLLERLLRALAAREDRHGLLPSSQAKWIFIDWSDIAKDGHSACVNMLYSMALEAGANIHRHLGDREKAEELEAKTALLKARCDITFWSDKLQAYASDAPDGKPGRQLGRHANIFAILSGVAPHDKLANVENILLDDAVEPVGTPYARTLEARALLRRGKVAEALKGVRDYWGGMLDAGATSFWEAYDASMSGAKHYEFYGRPFGKSLCHAWSAGPVALLSGDLFGAKPLTPGWKTFSVENRPLGLAWAAASIPTPHGDIGIETTPDGLAFELPLGVTPLQADCGQ